MGDYCKDAGGRRLTAFNTVSIHCDQVKCFRRLKNLWRLSALEIKEEKIKSSPKTIIGEIFKNKSASIIDTRPIVDLFPNTTENGDTKE